MAENPPPRPGSAPTPAIRLRITAVPETGFISVRFLANPVGIWVHGPSLRYPCPGAARCKECSALKKCVWKGFASAEVWIEEPQGDRWQQTVLEVSERLLEHLGDGALRGTVWCLYRQASDGKKPEVSGHQVDELSPSSLNPAFDVTAVVEACYRTPAIEFGRKPVLKPRPLLVPVEDDYRPPTATPDKPSAEQEKENDRQRRAHIRELLRADPAARAAIEASEKAKKP